MAVERPVGRRNRSYSQVVNVSIIYAVIQEVARRKTLRAHIDNLHRIAEMLRRENEQLRYFNRQHGNPAVVGMAGFATSCLLMQLYTFGLLKFGPVLWAGMVFGGFCLFISGFQFLRVGSVIRAGGFCTFGCYWLCSAIIRLTNARDLPQASVDSGWLLLGTTGVVGILFTAWLNHSLVMSIMFLCLFSGFVLADINAFQHLYAFRIVSAIMFTGAAGTAYYTLMHVLFFDTYGWELPLYSAPTVIVAKLFGNKQPLQARRHKNSLNYFFPLQINPPKLHTSPTYPRDLKGIPRQRTFSL